MPPIELDDVLDEKPSATVDPKSSTGSDLDVKPAASSPATDDAKASGTDPDLAVARDVVTAGADTDKDKKPEAAADPSSAKGEELDDKSGDKPSSKDAEDYSDVPFRSHPRFQQLIRQKNAYKQDAQHYREIGLFIQGQGLNNDEAAEALVIAGLAKTNPAQAWAELQKSGWIKNLAIAAGAVVVDEDLKKLVAEQAMTKEAALEVQKARALTKSSAARDKFQTEQAKKRAASDHANSIVQEADDWIAYRRARDKHFDLKQEAILKEVHWLQRQEGYPKDRPGARAQLNKAYANVNKTFVPPVDPAAKDAGSQDKSAVDPKGGGQGRNEPGKTKTGRQIVDAVLAKHGL
jgi:hypothetical protein